MDRYKKNEAIKINYIVIKKTTGLTDVLMYVYDEAGAELGSGLSPVAMTEIVGGSGLYYGSFTPDASGQWRIRIQSTVNGDDVQRVFEVGDYKLDDLQSQLEQTKVNNKCCTTDKGVTKKLNKCVVSLIYEQPFYQTFYFSFTISALKGKCLR
jgi:hypothetical protein